MNVRLAVFASGGGSNFESLLTYFHSHAHIEIVILATDKPNCGAVKRAEKNRIPWVLIPQSADFTNEYWSEINKAFKIDGILLAGYLKKIPPFLVKEYAERILNIHPALLPAHGGKGMYGIHIHQSVIANREKESGITLHLVNEAYDEGLILCQIRCQVLPNETAEQLAEKTLRMEHYWFPRVVEWYFESKKPQENA